MHSIPRMSDSRSSSAASASRAEIRLTGGRSLALLLGQLLHTGRGSRHNQWRGQLRDCNLPLLRNADDRSEPGGNEATATDFSPAERFAAARRAAPSRAIAVRSATVALAVDSVEREADRLVLNRFGPAGVVVNELMEITQFRGNTTQFLEHPDGVASLQLFKLVRPELVMPLRAAIRTVGVTGQPVREEQIALPDARESGARRIVKAGSADSSSDTHPGRYVAIEVVPFQPPATNAQYYLVLFEIEHPGHAEQQTDIGPGMMASDMMADTGGTSTSAKRGPRARHRSDAAALRALREENASMKRYLQAIVEEHEATTEELRAANEEIQSANEELQSTNEELETSKEEVQSTNEELTTVNEEIRHRNRELEALSSDLLNVLTSTTIPIVIVDRDLRLRRFTPASDQVMKAIPGDVGRPLSDVKLLIPLPDLERQILRVIDTLEITRQDVEDENGRWWELTIRPYLTIDRRVDGATLVFSDINASKQYGIQADRTAAVREELLTATEDARVAANRSREMAETANQVKSTFLASISHDLRTPLNAITGYTDLVAMGIRGPVTVEQLEDLARIKRSARHLLALINDILNFAKVEAGQLDFRMDDIAVAPIAAEMAELMAPQLADKSLAFELSGCGDDPDGVLVYADPEKLRQILLNLLTNAVKFTAPGGHVGIQCAINDPQARHDAESDGAVRVSVWDTGAGIAADQLGRIFEPFVQVDRGLTTPPPDGVGLGLAISRDLARAMGGDLTAESRPQHGSRFTLVLRPGTRTGQLEQFEQED